MPFLSGGLDPHCSPINHPPARFTVPGPLCCEGGGTDRRARHGARGRLAAGIRGRTVSVVACCFPSRFYLRRPAACQDSLDNRRCCPPCQTPLFLSSHKSDWLEKRVTPENKTVSVLLLCEEGVKETLCAQLLPFRPRDLGR